jgi:hypothetical protein
LVHSALRGRRESGQFMHFSLSKPVHAAHICPGVLTQTFRREVVQLRQRESERKNEASHIQSLHVREVLVKIARAGLGQDRHETRLLSHSIASHPAA